LTDDKSRPANEMATSAGLARFEPGDAIGPRTELSEEDALLLADCALRRERGWDRQLGCLCVGALFVAPLFAGWSRDIGFGVWCGMSLTVASVIIRSYKDAILIKAMNVDKKLRTKAKKLARKRVRLWDVVFSRHKRARRLVANEVLAEFGTQPLDKPSVDKPSVDKPSVDKPSVDKPK
jgi:hypothetical protein